MMFLNALFFNYNSIKCCVRKLRYRTSLTRSNLKHRPEACDNFHILLSKIFLKSGHREIQTFTFMSISARFDNIKWCFIVILGHNQQTEAIMRALSNSLLPSHRPRKEACDVTGRVTNSCFYHEYCISSRLYLLHIS